MIHTIGNNNCIGVEVPEGATKGWITEGTLGQFLWVDDNMEDGEQFLIQLPSPGSYTFLFLYPDGVTEDLAREVMMNEHGDLFDYTGRNMFCDTAVESLRTLFQSLNIHDKNIAVCKRR